MKGKGSKGAGVKSGLSSRDKFKAGKDCVSTQNGKNQVPVKKREKAGDGFTIG